MPNSLKRPPTVAEDKVVLRPATPSALQRLVLAATQSDRELDAALTDLGVLPPLELEQIRACLQIADTELVAGVNADGHRLIAVTDGDHELAWIHHDGRVLNAHLDPR